MSHQLWPVIIAVLITFIIVFVFGKCIENGIEKPKSETNNNHRSNSRLKQIKPKFIDPIDLVKFNWIGVLRLDDFCFYSAVIIWIERKTPKCMSEYEHKKKKATKRKGRNIYFLFVLGWTEKKKCKTSKVDVNKFDGVFNRAFNFCKSFLRLNLINCLILFFESERVLRKPLSKLRLPNILSIGLRLWVQSSSSLTFNVYLGTRFSLSFSLFPPPPFTGPFPFHMYSLLLPILCFAYKSLPPSIRLHFDSIWSEFVFFLFSVWTALFYVPSSISNCLKHYSCINISLSILCLFRFPTLECGDIAGVWCGVLRHFWNNNETKKKCSMFAQEIKLLNALTTMLATKTVNKDYVQTKPKIWFNSTLNACAMVRIMKENHNFARLCIRLNYLFAWVFIWFYVMYDVFT